MRHRGAALALLALAPACRHERVAPTAAQIEELLALDPCCCAGAFLERRFRADARHRIVGAPDACAQFLAERRADADARAAACARAAVDGGDVPAVLAFLATAPGRAMLAADATAIADCGLLAADYPAQAAALYGDRTQVGRDHVAALIEETRTRIQNGQHVGSPLLFGLRISAARIDPDQALAIAAFFRTAAGTRWLAARQILFAEGEARYRAACAAAHESGLTVDTEFTGRLPAYEPKGR